MRKGAESSPYWLQSYQFSSVIGISHALQIWRQFDSETPQSNPCSQMSHFSEARTRHPVRYRADSGGRVRPGYESAV